MKGLFGSSAQPPTYVQPPADPALAILTQQSQNQDMAALQSAVQTADARHALMYGTRSALGGGSFAAGAGAPLMGAMSLAR